MRAFLVFFALALFAMAAAFPQGVNFVDNNNPGQVQFVDNTNPSQGNYGANRPTPVHFVNNNRPGNGNFGGNRPNRPVNFVNNNPSDGTAVNFVDNNPSDGTAVNFVNNNPSDGTADNNPGEVNLNNPDPAFGRPSYETPDISPAWVTNPYPGKPQNNPYARAGK